MHKVRLQRLLPYISLSMRSAPRAMAGTCLLGVECCSVTSEDCYVDFSANAGVKAPFNALFMYGWGPIPALGGAGCAVSSALTSWITLLLFWGIWHFGQFLCPHEIGNVLIAEWKIMAAQLKLGIPIGLSAFFEVTSFTFMTIFISRLGGYSFRSPDCG